ncbi:MAG: hypothetical protein ACREOZ_00180, partial [Gloeomargaritales cyanobacterium]
KLLRMVDYVVKGTSKVWLYHHALNRLFQVADEKNPANHFCAMIPIRKIKRSLRSYSGVLSSYRDSLHAAVTVFVEKEKTEGSNHARRKLSSTSYVVPEGAIACNIERNILPQGDLHCNKFSDIVVQPGRDDQVSKFKWTASDMIRTPISDVSRRSYGRQNEIFLCYLYATIPTRQLLTDKALVSLSAADQSIVADKYETVDKYEEIRQSAIRKTARTILQDYENRPIHFEKLSDIIFLDYLIFVTNANKGPLSNAGYSNKRSALFDLFRIYGAEQTIKLQENLKSAMKSLKRKAAMERQKGTGRAGSGMDPMSFNLYRSICLWFLQKGTSDGIFGYSFLVVTWNLCCRAASTVTIQLKHISWRED